MKQVSKMTRLVTGAGLMLGSAMIAGPSVVEAGDPSPGPGPNLVIFTQVVGANAPTVLAELEYELYPEIAPDVYGSEVKDAVTNGSCESVGLPTGGGLAIGFEGCEVIDGSYRLGIAGVPDNFDVTVFCGTDLGFFFGQPEILEPGPTVEPDIAIGEDPIACFAALFDGSPLTVDFVASGVGHEAALANLTPEAYPVIEVPDSDPAFGPNAIGVDDCTSQPSVGPGGSFIFGPPSLVSTSLTFSCDIPDDDYQLGMDGLADDYTRNDVFCVPADIPFFLVFGDERIDEESAEFFIESGGEGASSVYCLVGITGPPSLFLDAVVNGGDASPADFGLEVFERDGGLVQEVTDPSSDECEVVLDDDDGGLFPPIPTFDHTACAGFALAAGEYDIGATLPEYGYVVESVVCEAIEGDFDDERLEESVGGFSHPVAPPSGPFSSFSRCAVTFGFVEQTASASVTVSNDFGGDAVESDFTVEVYQLDGVTVGDLVASAPAPASFTLPIGTYVFGVSGPEGYDDPTVEVTIEDVPTEAFDVAEGQFTLTQSASASAVIVANQAMPPTTTTTTTTTTVAPTTAAPTTAAPATTQAPTTQLPATGSGNASLVWLAALLTLLGVGTIGLARRRRNMSW